MIKDFLFEVIVGSLSVFIIVLGLVVISNYFGFSLVP